MVRSPNDTRLTVLISALLVAVTFATFWPVLHHPFITFDDPDYVAANAHVASGLTTQNILWAFRTGAGGNWHPLTWLSHMLDVEVFGLSPGGHHLTNLCFHAANSLLLFFALQRMTGALWRSALVAALFALHPLHVESVAWIAERKDVLSSFFFMLTLLAYARYVSGVECRVSGAGVHNPESEITEHATRNTQHLSSFKFRVSRFYLLSLLFFALGLMSKPMLVTLPFVLLLLDYWPLRRLQLNTEHRTLNTVFSLVWEKAPFFMLSSLSSAVTLTVQGSAGAIRPLARLSLADRLANTPVAYVRYLSKTFWPLDLAVFYPYPKLWPLWAVAGASLLIIAISALALAPFLIRPSLPDTRPSPLPRLWTLDSGLRTSPPSPPATCHLPLVTCHLPPYARRRLALVCWHLRPGHWLGSSRRAVNGRPLHLPPADRTVHRSRLGRFGTSSFSSSSSVVHLPGLRPPPLPCRRIPPTSQLLALQRRPLPARPPRHRPERHGA